MESCKIHSYLGLFLIYKVTLSCKWLYSITHLSSNLTEGMLMNVLARLTLSIPGWPQTVRLPELALHVLVLLGLCHHTQAFETIFNHLLVVNF